MFDRKPTRQGSEPNITGLSVQTSTVRSTPIADRIPEQLQSWLFEKEEMNKAFGARARQEPF